MLSAQLLRIGGILDPQRFATDAAAFTAYRTDRQRDRPWNDAWGRPLLLSFGLYHPRKFGAFPQDQFVRSARVAYSYSRSLYIAGAAVGPKLPDSVSDADIANDAADWTTAGTGLLPLLWGHCIVVAGTSDGVESWRTDGSVTPPFNAFATPPWSGIRRARSNGRYCLLSAPVEIR